VVLKDKRTKRQKETETNTKTILKADEVMLTNKEKEIKQHITLKDRGEKVRIIAYYNNVLDKHQFSKLNIF